MKIKPFFAALALTSILFLNACSTIDSVDSNKKNSESSSSPTNSQGEAVNIPTPSATPYVYQGVTKTYVDLLSTINQADLASNWVEVKMDPEKFLGSEITFKSKDGCYIYGFSSFQSAVNYDPGSYYDFYTTLGSYAQLGIIMLDKGTCAERLSTVVRFPSLPEAGVDSKVLRATSENIKDCLVRHSACFLDKGTLLPGPGETTFKKPLDELKLLSDSGFCAVAIDVDSSPGGRNSCQGNPEFPGADSGTLIAEDATDLSILRFAAQEGSANDSIGKYMIYGDGWAVVVFGSTAANLELLVDMNEFIKGTLIARY
jgi:hypothetical protein